MNYSIRYVYSDGRFPAFTNWYSEKEFVFWIEFNKEQGNKVTVKGNSAIVRL